MYLEGYMKLKLLRLTLRSDAHMHGDASKLHGFFAASFNEHALLHQDAMGQRLKGHNGQRFHNSEYQ